MHLNRTERMHLNLTERMHLNRTDGTHASEPDRTHASEPGGKHPMEASAPHAVQDATGEGADSSRRLRRKCFEEGSASITRVCLRLAEDDLFVRTTEANNKLVATSIKKLRTAFTLQERKDAKDGLKDSVAQNFEIPESSVGVDVAAGRVRRFFEQANLDRTTIEVRDSEQNLCNAGKGGFLATTKKRDAGSVLGFLSLPMSTDVPTRCMGKPWMDGVYIECGQQLGSVFNTYIAHNQNDKKCNAKIVLVGTAHESTIDIGAVLLMKSVKPGEEIIVEYGHGGDCDV